MGATISKNLYDTDFVEWTARTATLLREGRIDELDIENVAEEIESLGKSDRGRSRLGLARMLFQLIMQKFEQGSRTAIFEERIIIANILEDSPSLRQHLQDNLDGIYARAVKEATYVMQLPEPRAAEIPPGCPYTLDDLLEGNLHPL